MGNLSCLLGIMMGFVPFQEIHGALLPEITDSANLWLKRKPMMNTNSLSTKFKLIFGYRYDPQGQWMICDTIAEKYETGCK